MGQRPDEVSVVICAYNLERWNELVAAVHSCKTQTLPAEQVILVIDHNEELRRRAVREFEDVVILSNELTRGLSGARNTGVAAARSEVVAFLDDDAYADPTWLQHLVAPLSHPSVVGTGGWTTPQWERPPPGWFPEEFLWVIGCSYPALPPTNTPIRNPIGTNMALRRHVFDRVGGFARGLGRIGKVPLGDEETELAIRYTARYPHERFVMVREAVVHHQVPTSRLTWHYFWTRCWAEGISKAAVSTLVGAASGLSSERHYVFKSLPQAMRRSLRLLPRRPWSALGQVGATVVGTAAAIAGLLRGRLAMRRHPMGRRAVDAGFEYPDMV